MNQDALDADAALTGLIESTEDNTFHRIVQVRILIHDHRRIAAQFQDHRFFAGTGFQVPAHVRAASEAEQLETLVGGEQVGAFAMAGQNGKRALGQIGFRQHFPDDDGADGGAAGRLEHKGTAGGDGRGDLVCSQVQREIERGNKGAGADGHAFDHAPVALGAGGDFQVGHLAIDAHGFFGGYPEGVDQSTHFAAGILDGFARFDTQGQGQFVVALFKAFHAVVENRLALVGGQFCHGGGGLVGGVDGFINGGRIGHGHPGGYLTAVLVGDIQILVGEDRFVGQVIGVGVF